jgi:hypothetical protein
MSVPRAGRRPKRKEPSEPPPTPREEAPTLTDPVELETARVRSTYSVPPPAEGELESPESALRAAYETRFGSFDRVPVIVMPRDRLASQLLEGRVAMLVPLLDGRSSIREILDIGVVNPLDALAAIKELIERGIVRLQ